MLHFAIAILAQIKVLASKTSVSGRRDVVLAPVARMDECILFRIMQVI